MEETFDKLVAVLKAEFEELSEITIHPNDIVWEKLSMSSMNLAILLTCIELDFEVILSADEIKSINTFKDLASIIAVKGKV